MFDLQNVVIIVRLPSLLRDLPNVNQIDDERYDASNSTEEWSILFLTNQTIGLEEFVVPPLDASAFFTISISFSASNTFSDIKVTLISPLIKYLIIYLCI